MSESIEMCTECGFPHPVIEQNLYLLEDAIARATGKPGPVEVLLGLAKMTSKELAQKLYPDREFTDHTEGQVLYIRAYALVALRHYLHGFSQELHAGL